jgi:hypothetical protein
VEVDDASKQPAQVVLHRKEGEARRSPRFEFDEHVNVAVWTEVGSQRRPEQS